MTHCTLAFLGIATTSLWATAASILAGVDAEYFGAAPVV